jgi:outer membrane protein assembly factor BamB
MKARRILPLLTPVLGALMIAGLACSGTPKPARSDAARSWPMFGGSPSRNMVNTVDKDLPTEWSTEEGKTKNVKWAVKLGSERCGYFPPAIAGGKVFIATNNTEPSDPKVKGKKAILKCFRESDGKFLWQIVHDPAPEKVAINAGGSSEDDGLLSTPCVDGDRLYYVTPGAEVICADTDGKIVWRYDMMKELKVFPCYCTVSSPLVAGERVFLVTGNGRDIDNQLPSPEAPSFVAINKKTGKLIWKDSSPGKNILDGQWTSPAYGEIGGKPQVIFPGGDGWLYAFEPATGKPIWKFDCNPKSASTKEHTRGYIVGAPVVYDNKVYVGTGTVPDTRLECKFGHFWCIDATKTGDLSPVNDNFDPRSEANKKSGLVWHYGGAVVPRPKNDRDIYMNRTLSTAAIHDGLVYIADLESFVYCLDARTGRKYWDYDLLSEVWGSPYYVDGKVYIGAGNEVSILPHGKTPPKKDGFPVISMIGRIKTPVVAVNGTLYVLTNTHLYAIAKK